MIVEVIPKVKDIRAFVPTAMVLDVQNMETNADGVMGTDSGHFMINKESL